MVTFWRGKGFALPSIMIASVVMLMVLMSAISSVATTRTALSDQYFNNMAKLAAESGVAMAEACIQGGTSSWTNPLRPSSGCDGDAHQCSGAECYIFQDSAVRTTFSIHPDDTEWSGGVPVRFIVTGKVQLLRKSNAAVWKEYVETSVWNSSLSTIAGRIGDLPVGTSLDGYWTSPPDGYLFEDGSAVSRTLYADLFAVIGTTFGVGDGATSFNLPDSRGRAAAHLSSSETEFNILGRLAGDQTVTLTAAQIPSHNHTGTTGSANPMWYRTVHQPGSSRAFNHFTGWTGGQYWQWGDNHYNGAAHNHNFTTNNTGSGSEHPNIQPSIVKRSVIKYKPPVSAQSELPAGTSINGYWPSSAIPSDYLQEDGAAISRATYSDLFSAVGTQHGAGNGSTTFNLPDSRGRIAASLSASDAEFDTVGERVGAKTVTLTEAEMPGHTHSGTTGHGNAAMYRMVHYQYDLRGSNHYVGYAPGPYTDRNDANFPMAAHTHNFTTNHAGGSGSHSNLQPTITKRAIIKHTPAVSVMSGIPVGSSIQGFWGSYPTGFLPEDGRAVSRTTYADLFSVIGTTYGAGDGSTTFNIPDSRGRVAVNLLPGNANFGTVGQRVGAKSVALTTAQMPSHNHTGTTGSGNGLVYRGVRTPGPNSAPDHFSAYHGAVWPDYSDYTDANYPGAQHTHNFTTDSNGGGQAHPNIQPTITKLSAIKY